MTCCSSALLQHQLSLSDTDRSLSRAIEDRQRSYPLFSISRGSFCLHPSLAVCVPGHPGYYQRSPKFSVCLSFVTGAHSMGLPALCPLPFTPLTITTPTLQVQYLPGQRLYGPSILPWLPASCIASPRWLLHEHAVVYVCSMSVASCRVPSCSDRVQGSGACFFTFFPSSVFKSPSLGVSQYLTHHVFPVKWLSKWLKDIVPSWEKECFIKSR